MDRDKIRRMIERYVTWAGLPTETVAFAFGCYFLCDDERDLLKKMDSLRRGITDEMIDILNEVKLGRPFWWTSYNQVYRHEITRGDDGYILMDTNLINGAMVTKVINVDDVWQKILTCNQWSNPNNRGCE